MKRIILIGMCMLLVASSVIAAEFDNTKENYNPSEKSIDLVNAFGIGSKIMTIKLVSNTDQALIKGEAIFNITLYKDYNEGLDDGMNFVDLLGSEHNKMVYTWSYFKDVPVSVPDYEEVCDGKNNTCSIQQTGSHVEIRKEWTVYKNENLPEGSYLFKIKANKDILNSIDFIPIFAGVELPEFAWWHADWTKKRAINVTENSGATLTDYSVRMNITYDPNMNADYSDLRFTDSTESSELGYWFEQIFPSNHAMVWVKVNSVPGSGVGTIYMYYGNPAATTTSDVTEAFLDGQENRSYPANGVFEQLGSSEYGLNHSMISFINWSNSSGVHQSIFGFNTTTGAGAQVRMNYFNDPSFPYSPNENMRLRAADESSGGDERNNTNFTNFVGVGNTFGWNVLEITRYSQNTQYNFNYINQWNYSNITTGEMDVGFIASGGCTPGNCASFETNWTGIRKAVYPEPTWANFSEQTLIEDGVISKISPTNGALLTPLNINFTCEGEAITGTGLNITNITIELYNPTDIKQFEVTRTYSPVTTNTTANHFFNATGNYFGNESWKWNCYMCLDNSNCSYNSLNVTGSQGNLTFTVDNVAPSVSILEPTIETNISQVELKFNVDDVTGVQACWYAIDFGTNVTQSCSTNDTIIAIASYGIHNISVFSNDSLGNTNRSIRDFVVFERKQDVFENSVLEGDIANIDIVIGDPGGLSPNLMLNYNNTIYNSTVISAVSPNRTYRSTVLIPDITTDTAVMEFNWTLNGSISGNTGNGTYPTNFQNITFIQLDNCSNYSHLFLNFSLYDEDTKSNSSLVNVTIETDVSAQRIENPEIEWEFNTTTHQTNLQVCINNASINDKEFSLNTVTRYFAQDHVVEYHYIQDGNLTNDSLFNVDLYDLDSAESTSFLVIFKDDFFLPVEAAIIDTLRLYVGEGQFISVEHGKTNDQGETALHLVTEEVTYKFIVRKDGEILYTSPEYLALCQTAPCQINLQATSSITDHINYSQVDGVSFILDKNETNKSLALLFTSVDGSSVNMALNVTMWNSYLNETACFSSTSASSGTLTCDIPASFENTSYLVQIYKDNKEIGSSSFSIAPSGNEAYGATGIAMTIILLITLVFMAVPTGSGIVVLVFLLLGLITASLLLWYTGGGIFGVGATFMWLISAVVIVMWKMAQRRNA